MISAPSAVNYCSYISERYIHELPKHKSFLPHLYLEVRPTGLNPLAKAGSVEFLLLRSKALKPAKHCSLPRWRLPTWAKAFPASLLVAICSCCWVCNTRRFYENDYEEAISVNTSFKTMRLAAIVPVPDSARDHIVQILTLTLNSPLRLP